MKTTVIYHSADFDGIFCREIARKFLPTAQLTGWNFGDKPMLFGGVNKWYVLDLPVDKVFGWRFEDGWLARDNPFQEKEERQIQPLDRIDWTNLIWIDHHKSAIESHPMEIAGYRIDGVAACRLAWQWFANEIAPEKAAYLNRDVSEPMAVRLAGEYDIGDKRDPHADILQHGLRSLELTDRIWSKLLDIHASPSETIDLIGRGSAVQYAKMEENKSIIKAAGFTFEFEGLKFLACNHAHFNSHLFTAGLTPEHDACFGFAWRNGAWNISLYHAPGKEHHDLSRIAVKYGGGGHRGACGFTINKLPFMV